MKNIILTIALLIGFCSFGQQSYRFGNATGVTDGNKGGLTVSNSGADWDLNSGINANLLADGSVSNTEFQYLSNVVLPIQQQLDSKFNVSGSASMAGNIAMGGFKIVNLADGTNAQDAVTVSQLNAATGSNITVHPDSDETSLRIGVANDSTSLASFTTLSTDIIICKICPSIIASSSTTIDFSETGRHAFFDGDGNADPASYTLSNMQNGHLFEVYVNQTTEPTFSPAPTQTTDSLDWTDDSLGDTNVTGYLYKNGKGNLLLTWVKDF